MSTETPLKPRKRPTQQRSIAMVAAILDASARILIERGYAGMNTNAVAELAGVSVGSLYQYFPSKEALMVALRERHAEEMSSAIRSLLAQPDGQGLRSAVARLVRAAVAAHEVQPELHRVLEKELPFFDENTEAVGKDMHGQVVRLLELHRSEVGQSNLDLAAWMTMRMMESLVHAAVLDTPLQFPPDEIETAVTDAIHAFLSR